MMAYIVNLTIIMRRLFDITQDVSPESIHSVIEEYRESEARQRVHTEIRSFSLDLRGKDRALEKIIELIDDNCRRGD